MPPKPSNTPKAPRAPAPKPSATSRIVVPQTAKPATPPAAKKTAKIGDGLFQKSIKAVEKLGTGKPAAQKKTAAKPANQKAKPRDVASGQAKVKNPVNFPMPKSVIDAAKNWTHKTWPTTRQKIWKTLAKDKDWQAQNKRIATPDNVARMEKGKAPIAPLGQRRGKRDKVELDHIRERRDGAKVNVVKNLRGVDPDTHTRKITRKHNVAAGSKMAKELRDPRTYKDKAEKKVSTAQKLKKPLRLF
ncbi:MAG: hypothetical protein AAFQ79_01925 [Pseudomonadota bacterium]